MMVSGPDVHSDESSTRGQGIKAGTSGASSSDAAVSDDGNPFRELEPGFSYRECSVPDGHAHPEAGITVVTPTIEGREAELGDCIDSVLAQTVPAFHLVGYDLHKRGPAATRNRLMELVETPWALFLDDDDLIDPDYVATVAPSLPGNDVVYTWCRKNFDYNTDLPFDGEALRDRNVIPITACVRVESFRHVGGFPTDVAHEDWALWLKLLDVGANFSCIEEKKWEYRRSDNGRNAANNKLIAQGKLKEH